MNRIVKVKSLGNILKRCLIRIGTGHDSSYYHTVCFIADRGGSVNMKEFNTDLCMQRPSVTALINGMIKAGLVVKYDDKIDKRSKKVKLTTKGSELAKKVKPSLMGIESMLDQDIKQEDLEVFDKVLSQMIKNGEENWYK